MSKMIVLTSKWSFERGLILDEENQSLYRRFNKWIESHDLNKMQAAFEYIYKNRGFLEVFDSQIEKTFIPQESEAFTELM